MVMMHRQQQQHVSFSRQIRVRKHIPRSSISKEEMASTWYTMKEIYETKTILKQKQKFKRFLRDENKKSKLHEDRVKDVNSKLLTAALRTTTKCSLEECSVDSLDASLHNFKNKRQKRPSSTHLQPSNSMRRLKVKGSPPSKPDRRKLLKKSNSLPSIIQEENVPNRNYDDGTILGRQRSSRLKKRSSTHLQRSNSMRRLKVKGSPSSEPDRRKLLKKSNSLPSIIQDENEPNRNYDDGTILGRQRSSRLKKRSSTHLQRSNSMRRLKVKGSPSSEPDRRKLLKKSNSLPSIIQDENEPNRNDGTILGRQRSFRLKKRSDKNSNGSSSSRSLGISGFRESSPRLTTKRKSKSSRSLLKQSFVLDEEEPPLDYAL